MSDRPNLVILHAHDMGRYNSAYGHALPTPRMADFARGGTLFRDAHCAAPTCSPSRAAMLTGRTAHEVGMMGLTHRGWQINDCDLHLASWLRSHGYHTVLSGLQHELADPLDGPYAEQIHSSDEDVHTRDMIAADAVAKWLATPRNEPFFLWTGFFLPHVPFVPADPVRHPAGQMIPPPCLPDTPEIRADWADYAASVERTDQSIGIILDALRDGGYEKNTIVILTTDHGVPFPFMKCALTAHGTGVTLVIRDPRRSAALVSDALVSHLDLVPTVCDLLDVPKPEGLRGFSLEPILDGKAESVRDDCFAEVTYHAAYEPKRSVRTKRWNYIRSFDDDRRRPLSNIDDGRSKRFLMEAGLGTRPTETEALYDLIFDPQEAHNLAADPEHAGILTEMRARLEDWMQRTNDPLRQGPVPLPPGGVANTRESIHPGDEPKNRG